jgi:hypothetical protein
LNNHFLQEVEWGLIGESFVRVCGGSEQFHFITVRIFLILFENVNLEAGEWSFQLFATRMNKAWCFVQVR